jgi:hypothetical protein
MVQKLAGTVTPSQADLICPNYDFHSRQSCSPQAVWLRRTGSLRGLRPASGNLTSKFQLVQLEVTIGGTQWHSDSRLQLQLQVQVQVQVPASFKLPPAAVSARAGLGPPSPGASDSESLSGSY